VLCGFLGVPKIPELLSGGIGTLELSITTGLLEDLNSKYSP